MMLNHRSFRTGLMVLAVGVVMGLIIAAGFTLTHSPQPSKRSYSGTNVVLGSQQPVPKELLALQNTSEAFVQIAESVVPTVVTIQSTRLVSMADLQRFHNRDELHDLFRFRVPGELRQQGSGSGIIVSEEGFILTNVHVVDKAEEVRVLLYDNREFDAHIVGLDPLTEVAVVKISASDLPVARLGNSDEIRVGEWVLAVGNPLELRSTVTAGIISAKQREIDIIDDTYRVENFLQTDAAINPGNSGGALVNLGGQVIGVNTAIATESGYNAGFGFAIPINLARKIMLDLIHKGKVERGYLGIAMQNVNEKKARAFALDKPRGVFIDRVLKDSPAEQAGVRAKDVLLQIEDQEVNKSNQVQAIIAKKNPGESVRLHVLRNHDQLAIDVVLGIKETGAIRISSRREKPSFENLGLDIEELTRDLADDLGYHGERGVVVAKVERLSPAEDAGLLEGDVIVEVDDTSIESQNDFYTKIPELEAGSVAIFTVKRFNEAVHVFVEVPQP